MAALSLRLPESLHQAARDVAQQDGVSINQLVMTALAEKIAALKTAEYLHQRAQGADENDWDVILSQVPDVEPEAFDRLLPK
jgi:hypothetical protein